MPPTLPKKPFQNSDLAESAITLEAQIKSDAGTPTKPVAQIRRDADAAFTKNDFRAGMALLGQIVAAAPNDSTTWLRLARTIMQIRPADDNEQKLLLERASTAAYIAYQRTTSRTEEADSLALLGNVLSQRELWRPALDALRLSLELREVADVRGQYERLREQYGFRVLDYSVDADTASPRACFQFSEDLPLRTDFSPFVVLAGTDKPALSAAEKQLCVEGLQHGETYTVTLRAGLPSTVHETLSKSADFSIYVRDRKPAAHFSTTAYVLPRTGQRGIPVISTNTRAIAIEIYRIGDRNLLDTIGSENSGRGDFQRSLSRYEVEQLRDSRAGSRCGRANLRSRRRRSMPTSPPPFRSIRRSASSSPASTSWWRSRRKPRSSTMISIHWRRNGSSFPISGSPRSPAMTVSMSSSIRWRPRRPRRKSRSGLSRAATRCWPPAAPTPAVMSSSRPGWRAARAAPLPLCSPRPMGRAIMPS